MGLSRSIASYDERGEVVVLWRGGLQEERNSSQNEQTLVLSFFGGE